MIPSQVLGELAAGLSPEWEVVVGKWFGMPCLEVGGRVFAACDGADMAFKLAGEARAAALQIEGAHHFDPRGRGRPYRRWVLVPAAESSAWSFYARLACRYVATEAQALKDDLIAGLLRARRQLVAALGSLSPDQQDQVFLGDWSAKDLLAHLVGWDYTNLQAVQEILAGRKPAFWAHYDRDWQGYNALLVEAYKREDFSQLAAAAEQSHIALIEFLRTLPAEEVLKHKSIASLLRAEKSDEEEHSEQLNAFHRARLTDESSLNPFHRSRQ